MTLDASGNLGVGATSMGTTRLVIRGDAATNFAVAKWSHSSNATNGFDIGYASSVASNDISIWNWENGFIRFATNGSERARIDSSGNLLVGKTANDTTSPGTAVAAFTANVGAIRNVKTAAGTYESLQNYHNGTYVGGITYSDTATALATSSDERLKKNIVAAESATTIIDGISVKAFDWKVNNEHQRYGFIAQELLTIFPEAVIKGSDEQETLAVDNARFVPVLLKAIQEQQAIINSLKARLDAANL
jgi:hypothetical protein